MTVDFLYVVYKPSASIKTKTNYGLWEVMFSQASVCSHIGGTFIRLMGEGIWGIPPPSRSGQRSGRGYPHPGQVPVQNRGYPHPRSGPRAEQEVPHPRSGPRSEKGVPHPRSGWGQLGYRLPPSMSGPESGWGTPGYPPVQVRSQVRTGRYSQPEQHGGRSRRRTFLFRQFREVKDGINGITIEINTLRILFIIIHLLLCYEMR